MAKANDAAVEPETIEDAAPPAPIVRESLTPVQIEAFRRLHEAFCAKLPAAALGGVFEPESGDPLTSICRLPPGAYRPVGAEFAYAFGQFGLVAVVRVTAANQWGGPDVIEVDIA